VFASEGVDSIPRYSGPHTGFTVYLKSPRHQADAPIAESLEKEGRTGKNQTYIRTSKQQPRTEQPLINELLKHVYKNPPSVSLMMGKAPGYIHEITIGGWQGRRLGWKSGRTST